MFGTMWIVDKRFDIRFFAVASCMLGYIELSEFLDFGVGIHTFAQYLTAEKRIQVSLKKYLKMMKGNLSRIFFYLVNRNEMIDYCQCLSKN